MVSIKKLKYKKKERDSNCYGFKRFNGLGGVFVLYVFYLLIIIIEYSI